MPNVNLKGQAASNLTTGETEELMGQLAAVLEGLNYPVGQQMRQKFKLGGQSRWVTFTLKDWNQRDDQLLVQIDSIQ